MKGTYFILAFLSICLVAYPTTAQQETKERVHLIFDRTTYLTGENIWFSARSMQSALPQKPGISKVAYIEVLDPNGKSALRGKFEMLDGKGFGNLFIPATLETGLYTVNAYTAWMRNEGPGVFFHATLMIINPFQRIAKPEPYTSELLMYPESGNWTTEGINRMVVQYHGHPEEVIQGVVTAMARDTLAKFKLDQFGIGSFDFQSDAQAVKLFIQFRNGRWREEKFPAPGLFSTRVNTAQDKIKAVFNSSSNLPDRLAVQIKHKGEIKFISNAERNKEVNLEWNKLGVGINEIQWTSSNGEVLARRLVFKKPPESSTSSVKLILSDSVFTKRNKISVSFATIRDAQNNHLTVSVKRKDYLEFWDQIRLHDYDLTDHPDFFLSEKLIERLFSDPISDTDKFLILGHQSTKHEKVSTNYLPELNGPILEGTLKSTTGESLKNIPTFMASPSKYIRVYPAVSDENGRLLFEPKRFYGDGRLILQTANKTDSLYQVEWKSPYSDFHRFVRLPFPSIPRSLSDEILERSLAIQTNSIFPWGLNTTGKYDTGTFYGKPDEHYDLDDYTRFPVLEEVLREYVYGIRLRKKDGKFSFQMHDIAEGVLMEKEPLILVDGVPIFNMEKLMALSPLKIKEIDLVSRTYYLNGMVFAGIASFRTYKGDMGGMILNKNIHTSETEGMMVKKEFPFKDPTQVTRRIPDQRSVLFWSPALETKTKGNSTIEFFTSDLDGEYIIEAFGMDSNGEQIATRGQFRVR